MPDQAHHRRLEPRDMALCAGSQDRALIRIAPARIHRPEVAAELAGCLAAAFSTGLWSSAPMRLGPAGQADSALGIVSRLACDPVAWTARLCTADAAVASRLVGCAVGAVMQDDLIDQYGLGPYGAARGDGLLAFIGIVADARGTRLKAQGEGKPGPAAGRVSLARSLFSRWMSSPELRHCPRLFVRTRPEIAPVIHLCESLGFHCQGGFELVFRGERQHRLVYRRSLPKRAAPRRLESAGA